MNNPGLDQSDATALRALEERLLQAHVRRSPQEVGALLAEEFIEIGSSGRIYDRRQIIDYCSRNRATSGSEPSRIFRRGDWHPMLFS